MGRKDSLYKYTRLEFVNSTLNNGIFASGIHFLNDPYESKDAPIGRDYRVACLSRSRNKKLMWSHYADGHRGCSIKITPPSNYEEDDCILKRVKYESKIQSRANLSSDCFIESLYIKDKKWDYELEVRAVYCSENASLPCWKKYRGNVFLKSDITQVDFGCLSHLDPHYLDALIAIRDYNMNHRRKITVRKYKMSNRKYAFEIDKSFNYLKEISMIISGRE